MTRPIAFGFFLRIRGYGVSATNCYPPIYRKTKHTLVLFGIKFEVHRP